MGSRIVTDADENRANTNSETPYENGRVRPRRWMKRLLIWGGISGAIGALAAFGIVVGVIIHYSKDLPDYRQLASYEPAIVTRVHAGNGSLIREFAREPRVFVPIDSVPEHLIEAFLAAEDKNFYEHSGLDYFGLLRSQVRNVWNIVNGRRLEGGSTITQQVARNFLLTLDQRVDRKIKEMILTLRIERAYSKDRILELYLNEINFGNRSYGVAAAALNYFDKALGDLTVDEMAYLAALPKAPNNYHPVRNKERALARRNWVLSRMEILGFIDEATYADAIARDLVMAKRASQDNFRADYFAEEVRRQLMRMYGPDTLYEGGLSVRTTLDPRLQRIAEKTLRDGLVAYDRRHGWRGEIQRIQVDANWVNRLRAVEQPLGVSDWQLALVHEVRAEGAIVGLRDGAFGFIPFEDLTWARAWRSGQRLGPKVEDSAEVLAIGDVIAVAPASYPDVEILDFWGDDGQPVGTLSTLSLQQIPDVQGALVAMDPHTGRVLSLVGGFDFDLSQYNRATQATRQPGSSFKPFVYAAALENGFTPASLILDAPFVIDQGEGEGKWKPKNSSNKFYGPSTLRLGIEKSRNLMTVRLAQNIGMRRVVDYAERFGLADQIEPTLAASLGAGEVTLMDLTAAYGMVVNGGKEITPSLIDRIQDRRGRTVFRHDSRVCDSCGLAGLEGRYIEPDLPDTRSQIIDPMTAYQLVSMMEGVVQNGTGRKIRALRRHLAGKTGTTNDGFDAWWVGFSPDLVVGIFTGFDQPRSLGRNEEGSSVAVPIFRDFMADALKGQPDIPFRVAPGIRLVRINAQDGRPARLADGRIILEAFKPGTEPRSDSVTVLDGSRSIDDRNDALKSGAGVIY